MTHAQGSLPLCLERGDFGLVNPNRKKILVAVDVSNQSLEGVRYVSKLLSSQEIEVVLFHVYNDLPEFLYDLGKEREYRRTIESIPGWQGILETSMNDFMGEARQILIDSDVPEEWITIKIRKREGGIARDIILESYEGYVAVVVGQGEMSGFNNSLIGSVANKLIEGLNHVAVCVVGGGPSPENILVALDRSEGAMRAVDYVGSMFCRPNCEVTLLHVIKSIYVRPQEDEDFFLSEEEKRLVEECLEVEKVEMASVSDESRNRLIEACFEPKRVRTKLITHVSSRAGAIVQEARDGGYGTIVVGRRGLSEVEEFVMGRVSRKVIHLARERAVWVVP